jgi:hypothetical protein
LNDLKEEKEGHPWENGENSFPFLFSGEEIGLPRDEIAFFTAYTAFYTTCRPSPFELIAQ